MQKTQKDRRPSPRRKKLADSKLPHSKRSRRSLKTWRRYLRKQRIKRLLDMRDTFNSKIGDALR